MKKRKTDESVKAGLQFEGDTSPLHTNEGNTARHSDTEKKREEDEIEEEEDIDDSMHEGPLANSNHDDEERDLDDLVHGN